jgi:ABC-2 type transport system permease protein
MLRSAWFVARRDLLLLLRQRETILWTFVMPFLFFYFIGTVTARFAVSGASEADPLLLDVTGDGGFLVAEIERRLEEQGFAVERTFEGDTPPERRLTVPALAEKSFTEAVLAGEVQTVTFRHSGEGPLAAYDELRIARAVYGVVADLAVVTQSAREPIPESFEEIREMPRALTLEVTPAGERQEIPTGYEQAIPGMMVMFTMLIILLTGSLLLVIEREEGLLRRLASTPITPGSVVLGKWTARMAMGLVQIGVGFLIGTVMFQMHWGNAVFMIFAVMFGWAAFNASLGIFLANLARTETQMTGVGMLVTMVLAALGGCWWPIEITPRWMQSFSLILPTGWAMDAMHRLISFGLGAEAAVPHVVVMLVAALLFGWLGARTFRYT